MGIVVQKYGGSSVADIERLGMVADKVVATRRSGHDVVVVISAMGKSTDQLLALAKQLDDSPPRRELDMLLSTGERVSMALLSIAIQRRGCDAISFTGSQSGILTNDRHFDARILEVRPHRIEDELVRGRVVIVAGYQGMSYRNEITTLGRGGSDTTAIALAAALGADRAEIYSDVDGVYSADPRIVPEAVHLASLSYEAMQEMAEVGAKVLNAQAVEWARRAGIRIHARSTFQPGRETIIAAHGEPARVVVGQRGLVRVCTVGHASIHTVLSEASRCGIEARELETSAEGGSFLISLSSAPDLEQARQRLVAAAPRTELAEGLGAVSVVGDAFTRDPTAALEVLDVLSAIGVAPRRVTTSPLRLTALVGDHEVDAAVRAIHERLASIGATQEQP